MPCAVQSKLMPHHYQRRTMISRPPGSDPLDTLRKECMARNLCDEEGSRLPGTHWVLSLAISPPDISMPPNVRTVGIERITTAGIDFVLKRGSPTAESVANGHPVAIMHQKGHFLPGESAEQWRGEGHCDRLALGDILDLIPNFTVTSMVASSRFAAEGDDATGKERVSPGRLALLSKSHMTEITQKTRIELENGDIPMEVLDNCVSAFRFKPDRMECMLGGPDTIMWDRWEWLRDADGESPQGTIAWADAKHLIPN